MTVLRAPLRSPLRSPLYGPLAGKYGNAALALLRGEQGFAISVPDDAVAVVDNATPANNFIGTMAAALARGILVYSSPSTKYVRNASGLWVAGTALRCHYSTAGVPLGILAEPQRTNRLLNSASLATQSVTVSATAYTMSFEGTGTVTLSGASTAGPLVGTGATDRVSLTFTPSAGSLTLTVSGTVNYANLEAGLFRTSPIVTAGSQVTRNSDNLYVDLTKIPFSATVGTAIATAQPGPDTNTNNFGLVQFDDGTANNRLVMTNGTAGEKRARQIVLNGGSVTANIVSAANAAAPRYKQAMAWATNDIEMVVNGTTHTIDTSCAVPAGLAYMRIGRTTIDSTEWAAPIESIVYIPERLSRADMIARTS